MKTEPSDNIVCRIVFCCGTAIVVMLLIILGFLSPARAAAVYWVDGAGDNLWSSPTNWTTGLLPSGNDLYFTNTGASSDPTVITSILGTDYSVNSLTFNNTSGNNQLLYLQSGANLNISGKLNVDSGGTASLGGDSSSTVTVSGGTYIRSGTLYVNSGANLDVASTLLIGYSSGGTGRLNVASDADLRVGTTTNPIGMIVGNQSGTGVFALDSASNPNVSLNLSTLSVGCDRGSGTVDLSNLGGTFSVTNVAIGGGFGNAAPGTGHFIFGNNVVKQLTIPDLRIANGDITVNAVHMPQHFQQSAAGLQWRNRRNQVAPARACTWARQISRQP